MEEEARNRLNACTSPYLLQHSGNPVNWQPWDEEAIGLARDLNRPILVSIGYSACHWCHVMEHESFDDEQTAEVMNAGLVCIKVDREERPDVDALYMAACQATTGSGGWPLNVFIDPHTLNPFFVGTYFPPMGKCLGGEVFYIPPMGECLGGKFYFTAPPRHGGDSGSLDSMSTFLSEHDRDLVVGLPPDQIISLQT